MDHFHWPPGLIATLTPRQIEEWARHARDRETGEIARPRPKAAAASFSSAPMGEATHLARFLAVAKAQGVRDPAKLAAGVARIKAHYAATAAAGRPPPVTVEEILRRGPVEGSLPPGAVVRPAPRPAEKPEGGTPDGS